MYAIRSYYDLDPEAELRNVLADKQQVRTQGDRHAEAGITVDLEIGRGGEPALFVEFVGVGEKGLGDDAADAPASHQQRAVEQAATDLKGRTDHSGNTGHVRLTSQLKRRAARPRKQQLLKEQVAAA